MKTRQRINSRLLVLFVFIALTVIISMLLMLTGGNDYCERTNDNVHTHVFTSEPQAPLSVSERGGVQLPGGEFAYYDECERIVRADFVTCDYDEQIGQQMCVTETYLFAYGRRANFDDHYESLNSE